MYYQDMEMVAILFSKVYFYFFVLAVLKKLVPVCRKILLCHILPCMVLSGLIGDGLSQTSHGGSPALLTLLANCGLNRNLGPERFKNKKALYFVCWIVMWI